MKLLCVVVSMVISYNQCKGLWISTELLHKIPIFGYMDINNDGKVTEAEIAALSGQPELDGLLMTTFTLADIDDNGYLDKKENADYVRNNPEQVKKWYKRFHKAVQGRMRFN
ncbi:uncharacterized protein LOC121384961 [Gigantopelta aegis]|uniref:uncharacterized protein LOC121384961 n=1 Tax=Gigantopelta aegis TaxID=1735272 RepID=UPI001B887EEB|nr:uncharacterized protein LOC121384961 [Gigantopelta aegis]